MPQDFINTSSTINVGRQAAPAPPLVSESMHITAYGPGGPPTYNPQDGVLGQAAWSVAHCGEAFGAETLEAYVPHMVDQEYALEDDHVSFLGPGWEEDLGGLRAPYRLGGRDVRSRAFSRASRKPHQTRRQQQLPGTANSSRASLC